MMDEPTNRPLAGQIQIQAQLGKSGKSLVLTHYILDGEDKASIDARLDTLMDVADRQQTRAEVPMLEASRTQLIEAMEQNTRVLEERLEMQRKAAAGEGRKLKTNEAQQIPSLQTNLEMLKKKIAEADVEIAKARERAGLPPPE